MSTYLLIIVLSQYIFFDRMMAIINNIMYQSVTAWYTKVNHVRREQYSKRKVVYR